MKWTVQSAGAKNNRAAYKPNEDYFMADSENGVFIVADGVTMSANDYVEGAEMSAAGMVAEIAVKSVHEALLNETDAETGLRSGLRLAVERCMTLQKRIPTEYPACAVLVACCIRDGRIHCGYMGDSQAFVLRGNARIMLTERQTARLNAYYAANGNRPDKRYIYDNITNNINHPLCYGVVMGDMKSMDLLSVSSMMLEPGDRVIVTTDGLEDYLLYARPDEIRRKTPGEMIAESAPYDVAPYARYADDKSVIIIDIE